MIKYEEKMKSMETDLGAVGFQITSQRRAVIDYLASAKSHLAVRRLFHHVKKAGKRLTNTRASEKLPLR